MSYKKLKESLQNIFNKETKQKRKNKIDDTPEIGLFSQEICLQEKFLEKTSIPENNFGDAFAFSADGHTLAIGAYRTNEEQGAVYIYYNNLTKGVLQAPVDLCFFGHSVAVSANGKILAVAATQKKKPFPIVILYEKEEDSWNYIARLPVGDCAQDRPIHVALSADGLTLVAGGNRLRKDSADYKEKQTPLFIYENRAGSWILTDQISSDKGSATFGGNVCFSLDGKTLAVADCGDNYGRGVVYLYQKNENQGWALIDRYYPNRGNRLYGTGLALSGDGHILAIGTPAGALGTARVDIYRKVQNRWQFTQWISSAISSVFFGSSVALNRDGSVLAVGGDYENIKAPRVFIYRLQDKLYRPDSHVAGRPEDHLFGYRIGLNQEGTTLAVSSWCESDFYGLTYLYTSRTAP